MLDVIRNLVKSIAGKILLLIMVASFAVWGMGDLLTSGDSGLVAKVGNQKITVNEFYTQFRKKLSEFNQSLDKPLTELEAHNQQITYLVLNEMVYGKLVQEFANNNSLFLSDKIIKKGIISIPQFQDENGKFNKILFDNAILNNFNNEDCILITRTFLNKAKKILKLSSEFQNNKNIDLTISSAKPPIFWKDKEITKQQIYKWTPENIKQLIYKLSEIELLIKKNINNSINLITDFILYQASSNTNN